MIEINWRHSLRRELRPQSDNLPSSPGVKMLICFDMQQWWEAHSLALLPLPRDLAGAFAFPQCYIDGMYDI